MKDDNDNFYIVVIVFLFGWAMFSNGLNQYYYNQNLKTKTETLSVLTQAINSVDKIENSEELKQELLECVKELKLQLK